jgi:hypothetical protein
MAEPIRLSGRCAFGGSYRGPLPLDPLHMVEGFGLQNFENAVGLFRDRIKAGKNIFFDKRIFEINGQGQRRYQVDLALLGSGENLFDVLNEN